jgi:DNA-binding NtrC family response regulator
MSTYDWPGNVRELSNAVERAVITAEGEIIEAVDLCMDEQLAPVPILNQAAQLQAALHQATPSTPAPIVEAPPLPKGSLIIPAGERNLSRVEAMLVRAALEETGGQKSRAAELLGINRTTLYNKLRELDPSEPLTEDLAVESA